MEIVIDIDENVFTRLFDNGTEDYAIVNDDLFAIAKAIRNGTPLPKGHGRLIDADAFIKQESCCGYIEDMEIDYFKQNTPTIIEADKAERSE